MLLRIKSKDDILRLVTSCEKKETGENVYPCCSPLGKKTNFKLGNIRDTTSKEIREKLQKNFVLHILRNYGFDPFVDWANNNNIKLPDRITSSCDLCAMLFTEKNMLKILNEQKYIKEKIKEKY